MHEWRDLGLRNSETHSEKSDSEVKRPIRNLSRSVPVAESMRPLAGFETPEIHTIT